MNDLYPLMFKPYFKEFIWGGTRLATVFHKDLPPGKTIGESWEVFDKDVITKVNGVSIDDKTSLASALSKFKVGQQVNLTVVRNSKTITVKVSLGNAPAN